METVYEHRFEKLIISSISGCNCTAEEKAEFFWEFYKHGSEYYEELCDALFFLSSGEKDGSIFLTPAGRPYIAFYPRNIHDTWVLYGDNLPRFESDLYDQLIFFFLWHPIDNIFRI